MLLLNKNDKMLIHLRDEKLRLRHWILFFVCVAFYIGFNAAIIYLSYRRQEPVLFHINKYTLSGIIAQGQVVTIILLTLNPLKKSHLTALILCGLTSVASLITVLVSGSTDPLPGVVIPLISGTVSIIIKNYSKRLKKQLNRVLEYSRIVKRNEEMLHSLAYYDTLTGLPNRKTLMDQIEMLQKKGAFFYLVYIDIDDFKKINDTMGYSIGDAVMQGVAQRWKRYCRSEDLLARAGGDGFVILVCDEMDREQLHEYLKGFHDVLKEPICIGRKDFLIRVSYGAVRYPNDGDSAAELIKNAEIALYKAKELGRSDHQFFTQTLKEEISRKIRLENDLLSAAQNNELFVVYQPQFYCGSRKLRAFEALIRWEHPELGLIGPAEFIPIAEETGMIKEIGKWVIEAALNTFIQLRESAKINTVVSVNISVKQLLDPQFVSAVCDVLNKTGFESRYLEFEITESVLVSRPEYVVGVMKQLKKLGIGIALDDFGTRYASLKFLQMLPIDILKIGKAFIDKITPSHHMTGAIISLSHMLGIEVVAQGVEQQQQMDYLEAQQCDYIQGYLLSRPVAEAQVAEVCHASEH